MTPGPIDHYITRLERALDQRGCFDPRIVAEAREHLVDAVETGRARGLSIEDAEREALERFGAPDVLAAYAAAETTRMTTRLATAFDTLWQHKWWVVVPTLLTAIATSFLTAHFLPTRYRSEAELVVLESGVPADVARPAVSGRLHERVEILRQLVLNRRRLEQVMQEFGLYQDELETTPREELVARMRNAVRLEVIDNQESRDGVGRLRIAFVTSDPTAAYKVTERLAVLMIKENLQDVENIADMIHAFVDSKAQDLRRRLTEYEGKLDQLRKQNGNRPLSQADLIYYDVLKETYRTLLFRAEESKITRDLERRQIGQRFAVLEAPKVPERPEGPDRVTVNAAGTMVGLGLGLLAIVRRRSTNGRRSERDDLAPPRQA